MSVSNGQDANATNFNNAFISRTVDSNTTAKIDLEDAGSPSITDVQLTLNGEFTELDDVRTVTGTSEGDTTTGAHPGSTLTDDTINANLDELEAAVELRELLSNKDIAGGYAGLDGSGRIAVSALPTAAMTFEGMWNASTNTPTLADGTGVNGQKYIVSVGGTQDLGSGSLTYQAGDSLVHDGSIWNKLDTIDQVASVNSQTGVVVLDADDISDAATTNKYNQTHTGDVTGATALTIDKTAITGKGLVTAAAGDQVLVTDDSDSDNLKRVNVGDFLGGSSIKNVESFTGADTLDANNDIALVSNAGATYSITLPTAVGITGKVYDIIKTDATTNTITIGTTSSQTVGSRPDDDIGLNRQGDYIRVVSNGTNWDILAKQETEFLTDSNELSVVGLTDGHYLPLLTSVVLKRGLWRVTGMFSFYTSTGSGLGVREESGVYAADGNNTATIPTLVTAGANVDYLDGDALRSNYSTNVISWSDGETQIRQPAGEVHMNVGVSGGTQELFCVPRLLITSGGAGASVGTYIIAERIF